MNDLEAAVERLVADVTTQFVRGLISILRDASFRDVSQLLRAGHDGGHDGPEPTVLDRLLVVLRSHPGGMRAQQLAAALDVSTATLVKPLQVGVKTEKLLKTGKGKGTTYSLRSKNGRQPLPVDK